MMTNHVRPILSAGGMHYKGMRRRLWPVETVRSKLSVELFARIVRVACPAAQGGEESHPSPRSFAFGHESEYHHHYCRRTFASLKLPDQPRLLIAPPTIAIFLSIAFGATIL